MTHQHRTFLRLALTCLVLAVLVLMACRQMTTPLATPVLAPSAAPVPSATVVAAQEATAAPSNDTPTALTPPTATVTAVPITPSPTLTPLDQQQQLQVFEQIWELVNDSYVYRDYNGLNWDDIRTEYEQKIRETKTTEEFYQLMADLITSLNDDHSSFLSPQEVIASKAEYSGQLNYAGIGARIRQVSEGGMITDLALNGPAQAAGIKIREIIVAVNSIPFTDTEAFGPGGPISTVRGTPGTSVQLTIQASDGQRREVDVVRQVIPDDAFPDVTGQFLPNTRVLFLRIDSFYDSTLHEQVAKQIEDLAQGTPPDAIIIDLRTNGGGSVGEMMDTLALFNDGGSIGSTRGRDSQQALDIATGQTLSVVQDVPVAVLTSEETVSAAEMFAAGMQVLKRAVIVGEPSAGNTENLIIHDLRDGSQLWLAEYAFYLPDGSQIEGIGVQPDYPLDAEWWNYATADDPVVQKAQAVLTSAR